jgi:RNA polymerase sigma factor (sigma-70 family)
VRLWGLRYTTELPGAAETGRIAGLVTDQTELLDQIDHHRLAQVVERCLFALAPAAREAVLLRYQQELSYDEAAEVTGERPGTLQQRVARALPVLRKCVEAQLRTGGPGGPGGSR